MLHKEETTFKVAWNKYNIKSIIKLIRHKKDIQVS